MYDQSIPLTGNNDGPQKTCKTCHSPVTKKKRAVTCAVCECFVHYGCSDPKITSQLAALASAQNGFHFICSSCTTIIQQVGGLGQLEILSAELKDRHTQTCIELEKIRVDWTNLSTNYKKLFSLYETIRENNKILEDQLNIGNANHYANKENEIIKKDDGAIPVMVSKTIEVIMPLLKDMISDTFKSTFESTMAVKNQGSSQSLSVNERIPIMGPTLPNNMAPLSQTPSESKYYGKNSEIPQKQKSKFTRTNTKVLTFAEVLNGSTTSGSATRKLKILGNKSNSATTSNQIANDPDFLDIRFKRVITKSSNELTVQCASENEADKLDVIIKNKYKNEIISERLGKTLPQIKLCGFPANASPDELKLNLIMANPELATLTFQVVNTYFITTADVSYTNMIIESDLHTHSRIVAMKTLLFGLSKIKIFENTNIIQCTNCCKFGHNKGTCTHTTACRRCGEEHQHALCTSQQLKCINCHDNNVNGSTHSIGHLANDPRCPVFKERFQKIKNKLLNKGQNMIDTSPENYQNERNLTTRTITHEQKIDSKSPEVVYHHDTQPINAT